MELRKLKAKLVEKGVSYKQISEAIGMSPHTFNSKINTVSTFTIDEAKAISDYLELTDEERLYIFLS